MLDANGNPLKLGDRVRIHSEWEDPGGDDFECIFIEVPEESTRVLIRTLIPDFDPSQTERIPASQLIKLE